MQNKHFLHPQILVLRSNNYMLISTCLKQISTLCETTEFQVNSKEWCLCARAQIKDNQT